MSIKRIQLAWESKIIPQDIVFKYDPDNEVRSFILSKILPHSQAEIEQAEIKALNANSSLKGHYYVCLASNVYFIKIFQHQQVDIFLPEILSFYLKSQEISVLTPIVFNEDILFRNETYKYSVYPFIFGKHYDGSIEQLELLLPIIYRMHLMLKENKFQEVIKHNALDKAKKLADAKLIVEEALLKDDFNRFFDYSEWLSKNKAWLIELCQNFDPYLCLRENAQSIHGELHVGNVIFETKTNKPVIIDFEETSDSFYPITFDLSYIVHRFCMYNFLNENDRDWPAFIQKINRIIEHFNVTKEELLTMMRQVSWYNITLILARYLNKEMIVPISECDKFVLYERLTQKANNLLND